MIRFLTQGARFAVLLAVLGALLAPPARAAAPLKLGDLPREAQEAAKSVLAYCAEQGYPRNPSAEVIQNLGEDAPGQRLILFRPGEICGDRDKGNGVCSTDGCDFFVYSDRKTGRLAEVFSHSESGIQGFAQDGQKPALIVFWVRGGTPLCNAERQSSCVLLLTWNGRTFVPSRLR